MGDHRIEEDEWDREMATYDYSGSSFDYLDEPLTAEEQVRYEFRLDRALDDKRDGVD